jgi:hypothetical protein
MSDSAASTKKGYRFGNLTKSFLRYATNSSDEDPYYFGKLTEQVSSSVYKNVIKSNKLCITARKNTVKTDASPYDYVMYINRPNADAAYFGITRDINGCCVHLDFKTKNLLLKSVFIEDFIDDKITTEVYEHPKELCEHPHPLVETHESPEYAAAMIIGDHMLAVVWVDKKRYFVSTSSPCRLDAVYLACNCEEPKSSNYMTIQRI